MEDTVGSGDNNGCDILLKQLGGPGKVQEYLERAGGGGYSLVSISATARDMDMSDDFLMANVSDPMSMVVLLNQFFKYEHGLSKKSREFLWDCMAKSVTGLNRIRGGVPAGTVVAHKTGTGPRRDGVLFACNDVGMIVLPDGRRLTIAVFIHQTKASDQEAERMISGITKILWDGFSRQD